MMVNHLCDKQLAEMRQTLLGYAEYAGYSDAFRSKCTSCANLIKGFLDNRSNRDETAAAIEALFGPLAMAELARAQQSSDAEAVVLRAYQDGDEKAWALALVKWLPLMSEQQHRGMMDLLHGDEADEVETAPNVPVFIHPSPAALH